MVKCRLLAFNDQMKGRAYLAHGIIECRVTGALLNSRASAPGLASGHQRLSRVVSFRDHCFGRVDSEGLGEEIALTAGAVKLPE